jgi:hypothetical protein
MLALQSNEIDDQAVEALAGAEGWTRLAWLDLSNNQIFDAGLRALGRSASLGRLQQLHLRHNHFSVRGLAAFAKSPLGKRLRSLWVLGSVAPSERLREIRQLFPRLVDADF